MMPMGRAVELARGYLNGQVISSGDFRECVATLMAHAVACVERPEQPASNSEQVGGDHYRKLRIQPWDVMPSWLEGADPFEATLAGGIIKYIARYRFKNGVEDLKKLAHYCQRLIEHLEGK